jgi:hypothetical protein
VISRYRLEAYATLLLGLPSGRVILQLLNSGNFSDFLKSEFEERGLLAADSIAYDRLRLLHDSG